MNPTRKKKKTPHSIASLETVKKWILEGAREKLAGREAGFKQQNSCIES